MESPTSTLRNGQSGIDFLLLNELRIKPLSKEAARVENVLNLLLQAAEHFRDWSKPVHIDTRKNFLEQVAKRNHSQSSYLRTVDELGKVLTRYQWQSYVIAGQNGVEEQLGWSKALASGQHWEYGVVRVLLDKSKIPGEIERLRHCTNCGEWFHAKTSHQRFCGDSCRRRYTANSSEFKEKRRTYMKNVYRPQQKQHQQRSLELAKSTLKPKAKRG